LTVVDAALDANKQISQIENFLTQGVDVLIISPADPRSLSNAVAEAIKQGVPVIADATPFDGAATFVGIDDISAGHKAGVWLADYAKTNKIEPKILIVNANSYENCFNRAIGFKKALDESGIKYSIAADVDGKAIKETCIQLSQDALTAHPDINVIFGINDNSTSGGMAAYKESGLDESKLLAIGFGFEGQVGRELLLSGGPYKTALAMFPDYIGVNIIDASYKLYNKENIPAHYESGTAMITREDFTRFYTKNGNDYDLNFDAVRKLLEKK
jgi:ABC-type sugar transport system substrate-binding protein